MNALAHVFRPGRFPGGPQYRPVRVTPANLGVAVFPPRAPAAKAPRLDLALPAAPVTPPETPLAQRVRELECVNASLRLQIGTLRRENLKLSVRLLKYEAAAAVDADAGDTIICAPPVF